MDDFDIDARPIIISNEIKEPVLVSTFFTQNSTGVGMSTKKELLDIVVALEQLADLYKKAIADGKLDLNDIGQEFPQILEFIQQAKEAVTFETPIDFASLTLEEIQDLIARITAIIFSLFPAGEGGNTTTFKDLDEILKALQKATSIFYSMAEDGKISWLDIPGNLGGIIDFSSLAKDAAKLDGVLVVSALSLGEINILVNEFLSTAFQFFAAVGKLQGK